MKAVDGVSFTLNEGETLGVVVLSALNGGLYGQGAVLGLVALAVALTALALPRRVSG